MTRRELLLLLMGATALRFGAGAARAEEGSSKRLVKRGRFVVVGAGLSGLAAARELQAGGA